MISVVLTTYNGTRFLAEQLDSIRDQSVQPDEVIILDDCSSDGTPEMVRQYLDANHLLNWRLVVNETNQGWKQNFTNGFDLAQGDLVFPADQDDIWHLDKIQRMVQVMELHPEVQVLMSNFHLFTTGEDRRKWVYQFDVENDGSLQQMKIWRRWYYTLQPGCTYCFRRRFYQSVRPRWNTAYPHDGNLWHFSYIVGGLYLLNEELIEYRRHGDNETSSFHFTRAYRVADNDRYLWFNSEALNECSERDRPTIEHILQFLHIRDDVMRRRQMWKWPILLVRYFRYYNTHLGVFADLVYTICQDL